jgi:hypothetical protein
MIENKFLGTAFCLTLFLFTNSCIGLQNKNILSDEAVRCPAVATDAPVIRLVPQEVYGDEVLELLGRKSQDGILILQFNFFTDNPGNSYPKQIAQKLVDIRKQSSNPSIVVALESRKDADDPKGKGAAQRNAKTKKLLSDAGIDVRDVYGHSGNLQNPPAKDDGVSHTKLVMAHHSSREYSRKLITSSSIPKNTDRLNWVLAPELTFNLNPMLSRGPI